MKHTSEQEILVRSQEILIRRKQCGGERNTKKGNRTGNGRGKHRTQEKEHGKVC